ncbi:MAG: HD domain-containing protein [Actinomycetaceae bacterium]|nr:HD domain-containing protein [Actinomycetaceae bacterium]
MLIVMHALFTSAHEFLFQHLMEQEYVPLLTRTYRYRHCLRVAAIGRKVAEAENMDADVLELACLLHDVGKFESQRPWDHGRTGARIARTFLENLGLEEKTIDEICQGIAMHTDGLWNNPSDSPDFNGIDEYVSPPTMLARSVGDCDNVDRYGTYRIYDTLTYVRFDEKRISEQLEFINEYREKLDKEREYVCATHTAQELWKNALDEHDMFFEHLYDQISSSNVYLKVYEKEIDTFSSEH